MKLPGLHRQDNLLSFAALFVVEKEAPVDALVRALLLFERARAY
jgi:hypothetical protein